MAKAFVLITADIGEEEDVMKDLRALSEVKEAEFVYGVYDIIARIETESLQELKDVIGQKVRQIYSVRSTLTMIVV